MNLLYTKNMKINTGTFFLKLLRVGTLKVNCCISDLTFASKNIDYKISLFFERKSFEEKIKTIIKEIKQHAEQNKKSK